MLAMAIKYSKNANQLKAVNKDNEKLITIKKKLILILKNYKHHTYPNHDNRNDVWQKRLTDQ